MTAGGSDPGGVSAARDADLKTKWLRAGTSPVKARPPSTRAPSDAFGCATTRGRIVETASLEILAAGGFCCRPRKVAAEVQSPRETNHGTDQHVNAAQYEKPGARVGEFWREKEHTPHEKQQPDQDVVDDAENFIAMANHQFVAADPQHERVCGVVGVSSRSSVAHAFRPLVGQRASPTVLQRPRCDTKRAARIAPSAQTEGPTSVRSQALHRAGFFTLRCFSRRRRDRRGFRGHRVLQPSRRSLMLWLRRVPLRVRLAARSGHR